MTRDVTALSAAERQQSAAAAPIAARTVRQRLARTVIVFGSLTIVVCLLAPLAGSTSIDVWRAFDRSIPFAANVDAQIFFIARLPRVLAAAVVGATLATAGVVFQALLRNPLATPFTLGVSAGSSLGAMLAITFASSLTVGPLSPVPPSVPPPNCVLSA